MAGILWQRVKWRIFCGGHKSKLTIRLYPKTQVFQESRIESCYDPRIDGNKPCAVAPMREKE
jgi:hypothetical protein